MYSRILLVSILFLVLSCNSDDNSPNENDPTNPELKYLASYTNVGENATDTLVYSENRLILRKEYVGDFLDYNHNYIYNTNNQLAKISVVHSTSTHPLEETAYSYYEDGNLKTRHYVGYNRDYTENFTYRDNLIFINKGNNDAIRMTLNSEGLIASADVFYDDVNEFVNFIKLEYDGNTNLTKATETYRDGSYRTFQYTFDDKINPLFVFDYKLPNGLTIKQLEAVYSYPSFGGYTPGDDDNMIVYFNKNNFVSVESENGIGEFSFEYNAENYPTKITLPYRNSDDFYTLTYQP